MKVTALMSVVGRFRSPSIKIPCSSKKFPVPRKSSLIRDLEFPVPLRREFGTKPLECTYAPDPGANAVQQKGDAIIYSITSSASAIHLAWRALSLSETCGLLRRPICKLSIEAEACQDHPSEERSRHLPAAKEQIVICGRGRLDELLNRPLLTSFL